MHVNRPNIEVIDLTRRADVFPSIGQLQPGTSRLLKTQLVHRLRSTLRKPIQKFSPARDPADMFQGVVKYSVCWLQVLPSRDRD